MCLDKVYRGKEKQKILNKLPDEIICWKYVARNPKQKCYRGAWQFADFGSGWCKAIVRPRKATGLTYRSGFHAHLSRKDAIYHKCNEEIVIKCKVNKKDIIAIGLYLAGRGNDKDMSIVAKKMWLPKFRSRKTDGAKL